MSAGEAQPVEVVRELSVDTKTVWKHLTEPKLLALWMGPQARLEPTVGGPVRFAFGPALSHVDGTVVSVEPERSITMTWRAAGGALPTTSPSTSRVAFAIAVAGKGSRLQVRHSGLTDEDLRRAHSSGWASHLDSLSNALGRGGAGAIPGHPPEATIDAYFTAWNHEDSSTRMAYLRKCLSPSVSLYVRDAEMFGVDRISEWIGDWRRRYPGVRILRAGTLMATRGAYLASSTVQLPDGTSAGSGMTYFRMAANGLIERVGGFRQR